MDAVRVGIAQMALHRAAHPVEVFHAGIDDQAAFQTLALHHAIQHCGAGVYPRLQLRQRIFGSEIPVGETIFAGFEQAYRLVLRRALRFADDELALGIDKECVGQGAAGIDSEHLNISRKGVHAHSLLLSGISQMFSD